MTVVRVSTLSLFVQDSLTIRRPDGAKSPVHIHLEDAAAPVYVHVQKPKKPLFTINDGICQSVSSSSNRIERAIVFKSLIVIVSFYAVYML